MRWTVAVLAMWLAAAPAVGFAQERDTTIGPVAGLPSEVVREALEVYNAERTLRASGSLDIAAGQQVTSDVAVLLGPLTVAGDITGRVVVINGDLILRPSARIGASVLVIGGSIDGRDDARIEGDVRVYAQPLPYREVDGRLEAESEESWWRTLSHSRSRSGSRIRVLSAGAYNRVEGLPIKIGPAFRYQTDWGHVGVEGLGIIRTADEMRWDSENLGHSATLEIGLRETRGLTIGARHYDVVDPIEPWHLRDIEAALAAFLFHSDYRDYYNRHGGAGYLTVSPGRDVDVTIEYADERWGSRRVRDPFTLFRGDADWRENPMVDEGRFHVATLGVKIDTRNDPDDPWTGWYVTADYELGSGTVTSFGPTGPLARDASPDPGVRYQRAFFDLRRYNRISPEGQLNVRLVLGGWVGGDELPLQRRLSVGGAGTLPGYDFRQLYETDDVGVCSTVAAGGLDPLGRPAQCERVALVQAEYRGDVVFGSRWERGERWFSGLQRADWGWVVFANAGRGWLVGERAGEIRYPSGSMPSLGTFRTDLGLGLDTGILGVYVAKSLSHSKEPANVFVRVRHRF